MRIFLTGATGFIGSRVAQQLIAGGHKVTGLARSDAGAAALTALGAEVQRGALADLEILRKSSAAADAVIHCGFNHDFSNFLESCHLDQQVIETIGAALAGSDRAFIVSSGLAGLGKAGQLATENDELPKDHPFPRVSEQAALAFASKGVRVGVMRLPQVHNTQKAGLFTYAIAAAREKGVSAYVGDGTNRWAAAHVDDVAHLYRLAVEKAETGAKWHAVAEEGVPFREAAEVIARGLNVKAVSLTAEEAVTHFGWWGRLAGGVLAGSSTITRQKLGWNPIGPKLLDDLAQTDYSHHG